jgi:hypothetical protein
VLGTLGLLIAARAFRLWVTAGSIVKQCESYVDGGGQMVRETSVNVRITRELRAKLEKLAAEDKRSLSGYVEKLLREHVERHERRRQ